MRMEIDLINLGFRAHQWLILTVVALCMLTSSCSEDTSKDFNKYLPSSHKVERIKLAPSSSPDASIKPSDHPSETNTDKLGSPLSALIPTWNEWSEEDRRVVIRAVQFAVDLLHPRDHQRVIKEITALINRSLPKLKEHRAVYLRHPSLWESTYDRRTAGLVAALVLRTSRYDRVNQTSCKSAVMTALLKYQHLHDLQSFLSTFTDHMSRYCALTPHLDPVEMLLIDGLFHYTHSRHPEYHRWVGGELDVLRDSRDPEERLDRLTYDLLHASLGIKVRKSPLFTTRLNQTWRSLLAIFGDELLITQRVATHPLLWKFIEEHPDNWARYLSLADYFAIDALTGSLKVSHPHLGKYLIKFIDRGDLELLALYISAAETQEFRYRVEHPSTKFDPTLVEDIARWLTVCNHDQEETLCGCSEDLKRACLAKIGPSSNLDNDGIRRTVLPQEEKMLFGSAIDLVQRLSDGREVNTSHVVGGLLDLTDLIPGGGVALSGVKRVGKSAFKRATKTVMKRAGKRATKTATKTATKRSLKGQAKRQARRALRKLKSNYEKLGERLGKGRRKRLAKTTRSLTGKLKEYLQGSNSNLLSVKFEQTLSSRVYTGVRSLQQTIKTVDMKLNITSLISNIFERLNLKSKLSRKISKRWIKILYGEGEVTLSVGENVIKELYELGLRLVDGKSRDLLTNHFEDKLRRYDMRDDHEYDSEHYVLLLSVLYELSTH